MRLVEEFTARGFRVSTVKHAHHAFDVDREGTDSHRHRSAGASEVALVSGRRWVLMHELRDDDEPALAEILAKLSPCDLVLIEGYKREAHAKIEVRRVEARQRTPLAPDDPHILAIASDRREPAESLPQFDLDDISAIADFIAAHCGLMQPWKVRDAIV